MVRVLRNEGLKRPQSKEQRKMKTEMQKQCLLKRELKAKEDVWCGVERRKSGVGREK